MKVFKGYLSGTQGILKGYSRGTQGVLKGVLIAVSGRCAPAHSAVHRSQDHRQDYSGLETIIREYGGIIADSKGVSRSKGLQRILKRAACGAALPIAAVRVLRVTLLSP